MHQNTYWGDVRETLGNIVMLGTLVCGAAAAFGLFIAIACSPLLAAVCTLLEDLT